MSNAGRAGSRDRCQASTTAALGPGAGPASLNESQHDQHHAGDPRKGNKTPQISAGVLLADFELIVKQAERPTVFLKQAGNALPKGLSLAFGPLFGVKTALQKSEYRKAANRVCA